jgi:hypothetical protein
MEINLLIVLVCGVVAMVIGALWHGPIFGKAFMWANNWPDWEGYSKEEQQKKQKEMMPMYGVQFLFSLLQIYILAHFLKGWSDASPYEVAVWLWLGFMVPVVAGNAIWNINSGKQRLTLFGVVAGYQLVSMLAFAFILSHWG